MLTNKDFILIEFTKEEIDAATNEAFRMATNGLTDFGGDSGLIVGCLGETAFNKLFPDAERTNEKHYDFILSGKKTEIKSHICNVRPCVDWEVAPKKNNQNPDYFIFCFIHSSFEYGWVAGYIKADDFYTQAVKVNKGDKRPNGGEYKSHGFRFMVKDLMPIRKGNK